MSAQTKWCFKKKSYKVLSKFTSTRTQNVALSEIGFLRM